MYKYIKFLINLEDLNDITDTVKRVQSEKAYSLDNLYNIDDTIQKRKIANINLISKKEFL